MRGIAVVMLLALAGCAGVPKPSFEPTVLSDQRRFNQAQLFAQKAVAEVRAKVALKSPQQAGQASMRIRYRTPVELTLYGPFGGGSVALEYGQGYARLRDQDKRILEDSSPERLLASQTGWNMPIKALRYWLYGVATPLEPVRYGLTETDQLAWLEQLGWRVEFQQYRDYQGRSMPRKMTAYWLADEAVSVKVLVRSWDWGSNE